MAAKSKHISDIFLWISDVIESCEHPLQIVTARHLIQNFEGLMSRQNINAEGYYFMSRKLRDKLDSKRFGNENNN
jgi:hypothetical protein